MIYDASDLASAACVELVGMESPSNMTFWMIMSNSSWQARELPVIAENS